jgi:hypothetical protein
VATPRGAPSTSPGAMVSTVAVTTKAASCRQT